MREELSPPFKASCAAMKPSGPIKKQKTQAPDSQCSSLCADVVRPDHRTSNDPRNGNASYGRPAVQFLFTGTAGGSPAHEHRRCESVTRASRSCAGEPPAVPV